MKTYFTGFTVEEQHKRLYLKISLEKAVSKYRL
jgi:hypothetical protein